MKAKFTMLTHFSQRYAKLPLLKKGLDEDIGIAFDNMRVRLSDLSKIPAMLPALELMFTEHLENMKERSKRLENRREWERRALDAGQAQRTATSTVDDEECDFSYGNNKTNSAAAVA